MDGCYTVVWYRNQASTNPLPDSPGQAKSHLDKCTDQYHSQQGKPGSHRVKNYGKYCQQVSRQVDIHKDKYTKRTASPMDK